MSLPDETSPEEHLVARDELLQVMYWLRGESIAREVKANELTRWTNLEPLQVHSLLVDLVEAKLVEIAPEAEGNDTRFRLTDSGVKEGGRRFADEFAELTKPGHYECSDPNCECRRSGNPADCVHQH